jgi:hypothetical protein
MAFELASVEVESRKLRKNEEQAKSKKSCWGDISNH